MRIVLPCLLLLSSVSPVFAQHRFTRPGETYDPSVPTPRAILGYDLGERFTTTRAIARYLEAIAKASPRVRVDRWRGRSRGGSCIW